MIPLSIGTQGGGQQLGVPVVPPAGGGAGAEKTSVVIKTNNAVPINLKFFIVTISCKCIKKP
jgi:hypothetical protein